jgi:hypothetical protein
VSRSLKVAALVSIGTAALLVAAMRYGRTERAERMLAGVPGSARAVLRIDTRALERSTAANALLGMFLPDEQLSEIEAVCGLDPRLALAEATAWVRGSDEQPIQSIGLLLRGRSTDAATLADCHRALVEARGGSIVRIDSTSGPILASRKRGSAIAALDSRTIVTGSVGTVAEAVAVHRGAAPSLAEGTPLAVLWREVAPGSGIVAIADPPPHWKSAIVRVMGLEQEAAALDHIQTIAVSAGPGSAGTLDLHIDAGDPEGAKQVADVLESWLASSTERLEQDPLELEQPAELSVRNQTVMVTLKIPSPSPDREP